MDFSVLVAEHGIYIATVVVCLIGAVFPIMNAELYMLFVSSLADPGVLVPVVLLGAAGQITGKVVMYYGGRSAPRIIPARAVAKIDAVRARLEGTVGRQSLIVFVSAVTGFPPLYVVSVVAGVMRLPLAAFVLCGFSGRVIRFAIIVSFPQMF
jgi:membrane protein YqaA with SNARE-associated domain